MSPCHLVSSSSEWDSALSALPDAHLLQSWQWGEFKSRYGWTAQRLLWTEDERGSALHARPLAAAQILRRQIIPHSTFRIPFSILYCPKGPCLAWADTELAKTILSDLESLARRERAIFIKIDPEVMVVADRIHNATNVIPSRALRGEESLSPRAEAAHRGDKSGDFAFHASHFTPSPEQIQFKNTVWLDLTKSEDELLAAMKQKTRYNIRLAERKGVIVRTPPPVDAPLDLLYRMYAETSVRDGFVIRHADYYRDAWGGFIRAGLAQPFIAEVAGEPVAAIIVFRFANRALYMYGMSRDLHREKMPNHLLQWRAIQWAKAQGCAIYDFWGAPDVFDESDPMYGVWKFKEGFNGAVVRTIGALDYAPSPLLYRLYTVVLPRILDVMRRRGKAQTRQAIREG